MTLDDRLKKAVDILGDRLRDEIARELRMVTEELSAEARAEREAAVQSAIAGIQSAIVASEPPAQQLGGTRLLDAVRAIDEARSLTGVLDALVARAALEASRAGALLVRADRVRGWRDEHLDLRLAESGVVADAVRTGFAASTTATSIASPPFAGAAAGAELHAFPLALSGHVVAVLYAEGGDAGTLEILARHAARVLEVLTAFQTARSVAGVSSVAGPPAGAMPVGGDASLLVDVSAA